jgi:NTE family protein
MKACKTLQDKVEVLIHYIPPHADMACFGVASKSNTALAFLKHLRDLGREVAAAWENGEIDGGGAPLLGQASDTNLERLFIDPHHAQAAPLPEAVQGARTIPGAPPSLQKAEVEPAGQ